MTNLRRACAGEEIAQLNSSAAKQREAELLLDDSDSDMESDVVFAHIMARQHGGHARHEPLQASEQPTDSAAAAEPLGPSEQLESRTAAGVQLQDVQHKAAAPSHGSTARSLAGSNKGEDASATAEQSAGPDSREGKHKDSAADDGHSNASQHVSAVADAAESGTVQHTAAEADAAKPAQHVSTVTDAAATGVSEPGTSGKAAADDTVAHPLSSAASLQRSISQQRGKKPSQKAVGAMWELLECSIAPQLQLDLGMIVGT